jgi:hypothetical protein
MEVALNQQTVIQLYSFYGKGNENHEFGSEFFLRKRIISTVKKIEFVSDKNVIHDTKRSLVQYHSAECSCPN